MTSGKTLQQYSQGWEKKIQVLGYMGNNKSLYNRAKNQNILIKNKIDYLKIKIKLKKTIIGLISNFERIFFYLLKFPY